MSRDVTPPRRPEVPLTQLGAPLATPGDTSSESGDAAGGAAATRGGRGLRRGSGRGSRATGNGRGTATNRGRTPRPSSSEPPSDPGSRGGSEPPSAPGPRGGSGEESELRRQEGGSEAGGSASGSVGRPRAFIDASQDGVICGGCRAAVARGHRVVRLPCGHRHVMHARCVVEAIRRGGLHVQLICGTRGCTGHHRRRELLEAAVQANPGLRVAVAGLRRRPDNSWGERREELCYPWDQTSLGLAGPLDDVSLEQLQQRFITVVKV